MVLRRIFPRLESLAFIAALCLPITAKAEVRLPALVADSMVVQQGVRAPIWGWADPGERVTVSFCGQSVSAKAKPDGTWRVDLSPLTAGGPFDMTIAGKNTVTLHNVLVGEVWVCAGQSNMWWPVKWSLDAEEEIRQGRNEHIHLFTVPRCPSPEPRDDVRGKWVTCTPETVAEFSAVGYVFGKNLHQVLGCPVGLIKSAYGATPAESWTPRPALEADRDFRPILDRWNKFLATYPKLRTAYFNQVARWRQICQKAAAAGEPRPPRPLPVQPDPCVHPWLPGGLYNSMVHPLTRYAIKGVIWYQGEQNADRGYQYRKLFPTLIKNWRKAWRANFPFLYVQLANYLKPPVRPGDSQWAELREAQARALVLPKTGMAVSIDVGDANSIHPKDKEDVGKRLALLAEALVYGRDIVYSGPLYESMKIEGDAVHIRFRFAQGGLMTKKNEPVKGFAIAGADRTFVWAQAAIDGETVVVRSPNVSKPVAVRYAWADNPPCNLYNRAGLPASPFRTDDWPGITQKAR